MKLNFKILSSFIAFTILIITSSKKDKPVAPPLSGGTTLDKEVYLDSVSGSVSTLYYRYNSSGDLVSISSGSGGLGGDSLIYSAPGKLLRYKAGNVWGVTMVYDSLGRISCKIGIAAGQTIPDTISIYAYDEQGRIISDTSYFGTDKVLEYHAYSYDNNDNIVSYQRYNRFASDTFLAEGIVIATYDHHPNPHLKYGKWIYYADGDYRYLFKENSVGYLNANYKSGLLLYTSRKG
ncbi:MAG: hypothetical protein JWM28_949 [Chitinophagaceae bacterium]|nr:hypothetical protein [Chitinophagaceae bacterium]